MYLCKIVNLIIKIDYYMKKHWFLMVIVGTMISFSSCKKEEDSMIIGQWELISVECDDCLEVLWIPSVYEFYKNNRFSWKAENIHSERGKYFIENNTITFDTPYCYSMEMSFSDSKTMIWKDKDGGFKTKSTLQKIK